MRIKKTSETRAIAGKILNVDNNSTTDTLSANLINTKLTGKVDTITVTLSAGASYTFNSSTRGTYIVTTTSNAATIKSCYLVMTGNAGANIINLASDTGSAISVTSTGSTIVVANSGAYATKLTIITLANV